MRSYSTRALRALAFLFRPYNDIDVYVEDTACRNVYQVLIERMLKGRARVLRVFQLGGRSNVIEECQRQQGTFTRPSLFLVDADLHLLTGAPAPRLERLYQLKVYCSENLVFCGAAATEIAFESLSNTRRDEVRQRVGFGSFASEIAAPLRGLFIVYAAAHRLRVGIATSRYHVYQLCTNRDGQPELDGGKVRRRRQKLLAEMVQRHSSGAVRKALRSIMTNLRRVKCPGHCMVSGKTYLLPLLLAHLRRVAGYRGPMRTLIVQLARYCNLETDTGLAEAVRAAGRS